MTEDNKYNPEETQDNTHEDSLPELYEHHRIVVDKGQGLIRIDKYLTNLLGGVSRTRFQNAADFGFITVNGETVKSSYRVKPLDEIVISLETPPSDYTIVPQDIPLSVVFEDDDIMVVNKTPDMVVHPGVGNLDGTLLNAIAWYLRDNPKFDVNNPRVGLVHRIDKDTSGLLLIAKNEQAKSFLGKQFQDKTTKRTYNALVWGIVKDDTGTVDGALARNPKDRMQFCVFDPDENPLAKHAVTHYRVLRRFKYTTLLEDIRYSTTNVTAATRYSSANERRSTNSLSATASRCAHGRLCTPRHWDLYTPRRARSCFSTPNFPKTSNLFSTNGRGTRGLTARNDLYYFTNQNFY